ncbi:hypothetical protein LSAT2_001452 [Lamellibrachia satsuma]|nr:hypothetical protein LSAT2_001452 [Lamellibrachia satsuma]
MPSANRSKGSVIVTYNLEMKRFYTLAALTSIMKKFLKDHNNQLGLFYVSPESITFADVDMCHSNPCQNGGTCHNLVDVYKCDCVDSFERNSCESSMGQEKATMFIGIVVCVFVVIVICLVIGCVAMRRRRQPPQQESNIGREPTGLSIGEIANSDIQEYDNRVEQHIPARDPRQPSQADTSSRQPPDSSTPYLRYVAVRHPNVSSFPLVVISDLDQAVESAIVALYLVVW